MKKGLASKVLVIQAAVLLVSAPIVTASPHIIYAASEPVQKVIGTLGTISVEKVTQDENGHLNWELSITKEASTSTRQLAIEFEDKQTLDFKVSEANSTDQEIIPDEAGRYLLGMANQSNETVNINVQTETVPEQVDYQLKIATYVLEDEQQLALTNPLVQTFSYQLEETDTSTSDTLTTSTSETGDRESVNSSEEISSEESEVSVDSSTSDSESVTETTTSTEDETIVDTITTTESSSSETESSEETTVSSSQTESTEETTSSSSTTEESSVKPQSREVAVSGNLGDGNPNVPKGAIEIDGIFGGVNQNARPGGVAGDSGVHRFNDSDQNNGRPFSEIQITGKQNAVSIWSNPAYRMDFSKNFSGRTYINFGNKGADGIAFVMHNDPKGIGAFTGSNESEDGQNLGVYGSAAAKGSAFWGPISYPNEKAIQNSVAIEFDGYENEDGNTRYDYREDLRAPHMAYSFPGSKNGYVAYEGSWPDSPKLGGVSKAASVQHYGTKSLETGTESGIRNDTWYEFRYDYDTANGLTYYLRNPLNPSQTTGETTIPRDDLYRELKLTSDNPKAYWGFTGANGAETGTTKFVFTQVPVDLDTRIKNDVFSEYQSKEQTVVDVNADDHDQYPEGLPAVTPGNPVTFKTSFKVAEGEDILKVNQWSSYIEAKYFNLDTISKVQVAVNGEAKEEVVPEKNSEGEIVANFENLKLEPSDELTLSYTVSSLSENETSKSSFISQFDTTEIGNGTPISFNSNEVSYWFAAKHQTELSWKENELVTETSLSLDRSEIPSDGFTRYFYWRDLDKGDRLKFQVKKVSDSGYESDENVVSKGDKEFSVTSLGIPRDKFSTGENEFVVEAYLINGEEEVKEAATLNLKVTVTEKIALEVIPDNLSWTNRKVGESLGTLNRDDGNKMTVTILDSHEKPIDWDLTVQAVYLNENEKVPFSFIFKNSKGDQSQEITKEPLPVMSSDNADIVNYRVTKEWSIDSGILLSSPDYLSVGNYSNKVEMKWMLSDTAKIE